MSVQMTEKIFGFLLPRSIKPLVSSLEQEGVLNRPLVEKVISRWCNVYAGCLVVSIIIAISGHPVAAFFSLLGLWGFFYIQFSAVMNWVIIPVTIGVKVKGRIDRVKFEGLIPNIFLGGGYMRGWYINYEYECDDGEIINHQVRVRKYEDVKLEDMVAGKEICVQVDPADDRYSCPMILKHYEDVCWRIN